MDKYIKLYTLYWEGMTVGKDEKCLWDKYSDALNYAKVVAEKFNVTVTIMESKTVVQQKKEFDIYEHNNEPNFPEKK